MNRRELLATVLISVGVTAVVFYLGFLVFGQMGAQLAPGVLRVYDDVSRAVDSSAPVNFASSAETLDGPPTTMYLLPVAMPDGTMRQLECTVVFADKNELFAKWETSPGFLNEMRDTLLLKVQSFATAVDSELPAKFDTLIPYIQQTHAIAVTFKSLRWVTTE